jgi:hypothetical protein
MEDLFSTGSIRLLEEHGKADRYIIVDPFAIEGLSVAIHHLLATVAAGRPVKKTSRRVLADTVGTPSIREERAQPACTSGLNPSASCAADGRRTRCGTRRESVPNRG